MAKKRRRVVNNKPDRDTALTWLIFGMLVGGILVFTLVQPEISPRYSPSFNSGCDTYRIYPGEYGSCEEKCASLRGECFGGQDPDTKAIIGCSINPNYFDLGIVCTCCNLEG